MVRCQEEEKKEFIGNKFGGDGFICVQSLNSNDAELNNKGRVFAHTTLLPGCSIGYHKHENESEIYYITSGEGEFNDNGKIVNIKAGDVTYTMSGMGHGIRNTGSKPLEIVALILYA